MRLKFLLLVGLVVLMFLPNVYALPYGLILNTDEDQNRLNLEVPDDLKGSYSGNSSRPVVAFLAIDRIFTEEDDRINFVSVCKNEGTKGNNECRFVAMSPEKIFYDGCNGKDINGGINEAGGLTVCRGSFEVDNGDVYLVPYASRGSEKNYLFFKIPNEEKERGIVTIFNGPSLKQESNLSNIPLHHPLTNNPVSEDYGEYTWILTDVLLEDQEGNSIDRYPINTKNFLKGEKLMIWDYDVEYTYYNLSENVVSNSGFEEGVDGWTMENGDWTLSNTSHSGNHSLYISSSENHEERYAYQKIKVNPNTIINVSGWIKTKNIEKRSDGNGIYIRAKLKQPNGNVNEYTEKLNGNNNWKEYNLTLNTRAAEELTLYLYHHKSTGEAWFDDFKVRELSNISEGEIIDIGKHEDTVYTLYDNTELTIEPLLDLDYSEEKTDTEWIIIGEDSEVKKEIKIESKSSQRPQPLNLTPNMKYPQDYIEDSCSPDQCLKIIIIEPGSSEEFQLTWEERGVEMKYLGIEQNASVTSTPDEQHLFQKVQLTNIHSSRKFTDIEGSVLIDGTCENWIESQKNIDWGEEWLKEESCYFYVDELGPGESVINEVGFYGDFLDLKYGPVEQDPARQSTLEKQYLRREVKLNTKNRKMNEVDWNIEFRNQMPGTCMDCEKKNISKSSVLYFKFDQENEDKIKDYSGNGNDGTVNGIEIVEGKFKKAASFDGNKSYIKINTEKLNPDKITITAWIKPSEKNSRQDLIGKYRSGPKTGYEIWIEKNGELGTFIGVGNETRKFSAGEVKYGEWNSIGMSYSGETILLYLNGNFHERRFDSKKPISAEDRDMRISDTWFGSPFIGKIDELKIYPTSLKKEGIEMIFTRAEDDEKNYIHSEGDFIKLEEVELQKNEKKENSWIYHIPVINKINFTLNDLNLCIDGKTNMENISSEILENITLNGSEICFLVPEIMPGENEYKLNFNSTKELPEKDTPITGMITKMKNLFSSFFVEKNLTEYSSLILPFEEGNGEIVFDKSPNAYKGKIYGNPRWFLGKYGMGLDFNGEDDYIEIENYETNKNSFTISMWFKPGKFNMSESNGALIKKDGSFCLHFWSNSLVFDTWHGGERDNSVSVKIEDNKFHHVATVFKNGTKILYLDGEKIKEMEMKLNSVDGSDKNLTISGNWGERFNGTLDEIRIYNRALSDEELLGVMAGENIISGPMYSNSVIYLLMLIIVLLGLSLKYIKRKISILLPEPE